VVLLLLPDTETGIVTAHTVDAILVGESLRCSWGMRLGLGSGCEWMLSGIGVARLGDGSGNEEGVR
jgi:hypothetical protein